MIRRDSPFKLTTHFRGWSRVLAFGLTLSLILNFALIYANVRQSANFATPRIVISSPSGIVLPVAASAFVWSPDVAKSYVRLFLPILYTFNSTGTPSLESWAPFIHPDLLKSAHDRFQKNQIRIQGDGLNQTLFIRDVQFDSENTSAIADAEIRLIDRNGQVSRTQVRLQIQLTSTADPLNPYGHAIISVH
jgi:hypothetical protein